MKVWRTSNLVYSDVIYHTDIGCLERSIKANSKGSSKILLAEPFERNITHLNSWERFCRRCSKGKEAELNA